MLLALDNTLDIHRQYIQELEAKLCATALLDSPETHDIPMQLDNARAKCRTIAETIQRKKAALGVDGRTNLASITRSPYLRLRMNARALKKRIQDRLRHRKFELEKLERSYRHTMNGQFSFSFVYCACADVQTFQSISCTITPHPQSRDENPVLLILPPHTIACAMNFVL